MSRRPPRSTRTDTLFPYTTRCRSALTRHQIVATKAATQAFSHPVKIIFYGVPLIGAASTGMPPWWFFAVAAPLAMIGAWLGGMVLDRSEEHTSELQSLMRISYAVICFDKKKHTNTPII